jgi:hypothetical protein
MIFAFMFDRSAFFLLPITVSSPLPGQAQAPGLFLGTRSRSTIDKGGECGMCVTSRTSPLIPIKIQCKQLI